MKRTQCHRLLRTAGLLLLLPVVWACPQRTEVWVARGSKASDLMFVFGRERGREAPVALGMVTVHACADSVGGRAGVNALWHVVAPGAAREVSRTRYGEPPPGFQATARARPLAPGCYVAEISGTGTTRFQVRADGTVFDVGRAR